MSRLAQPEKHGGAGLADVSYVMITVDGERDTALAMNEFLARYSPRIIGLTGGPGQVRRVAFEFSAAFLKEGTTGREDRAYDVAHSPQVFLMNAGGHLRAEFYNADFETMKAVVLAVQNGSREPLGNQR